ncbi:hypothetical protein [Escherichia coli]|uniref:hypothetical protein n=1 Tax=Escherichia coli TaxID=562 RepID=UPI00388E9E9E
MFEQSPLRYIAAGLGVPYEQLSRNYAQMSYPRHGPVRTSRGVLYGAAKIRRIPSGEPDSFLCWLEEPSFAAW